MKTWIHDPICPNLRETTDTRIHGVWLILCFSLLIISPKIFAADIVDIKQSIIALRSDTISTVPGNSQRKLLKNLNNALGSLENASTMLVVGKRRTAINYVTRAEEYMDNYLRRLNKLVQRGDISEAIAQPLALKAQRINTQLRD
jgi:hypothetical protein